MTKKKILIGINTLTEVNQAVYMNHMQLFYRLGKSYPKWDFGICAPRRMAIDNMRNFSAKAAIEGDFDYLWFIDDDVMLQPDALAHLLELRSDIAAGITLIRGYPYEPMLFGFTGRGKRGPILSEYKDLVQKDGSIRRAQGLDAVGFSCCLIKTSLLEKVEAPWFLTGPNFTEDVFFCNRAREFKKNLTIAASNHVQTEHILGAESISPANREAAMRYDELLQPALRKYKSNKQSAFHLNGVGSNADRFTVVKGRQLAENYSVQKGA